MLGVIDASLAAAWHFPDEQSETTAALLRALPGKGAIVPALFWFEIRNLLLMGERRQRTSVREVSLFLARLNRLPIEIDRSPLSETLMAAARSHGFTAYDAAYLELALRRALPLATLDRRLAAAAGKTGNDLLIES
jgi:predicted nucleic acid-binding protein